MNKKDLILNVPINPLSFGNVSINFLREIFKKDLKVSIFPVGDADISVFDKLSPDFINWLNSNINNRFDGLTKDTPTLKLFHLNGSENRISSKQYLFTFHELDSVTNSEISLCKFQDLCIFSSSYSKKLFEKEDCYNTANLPLGFDCDFYKTGKDYMPDKITFGISGKLEKRKHTEKIIKLWISKYGGNMDYRLNCLITNPFIPNDEMNQIINGIIGNNNAENVTFYGHQKNNSMMNAWLNSVDIDLSGLSGGEGWNLGAFNSTCLGKWSIVLDHTSHSDWANEENCILVKPNGKEPCYDGIFFKQGGQFNQGNIHTFDDKDVLQAFEKAESLAKKENKKGIELGKEMTYDKTVNKLLKFMDL